MQEENSIMENRKVPYAQLEEATAVEMKPGITRRTLAYNEQGMMCQFILEKGATLELHHHPEVQIGYMTKGKVKLIKADGSSIIATAGTSWVFDSNEVHGVEEVYETSELVECFLPLRPDYI
jgi:quercetin dioxygenase-like cupin family protein